MASDKPDQQLFNTKTIKQLSQDINLTKKQIDAASTWLKLLDDNKLEKEKLNYLKFNKYILDSILDYTVDDVDYEKDNIEYQIKDSNDNSIICIEVKGTATKDLWSPQIGRKSSLSPVDQLWNYMIDITPKYGICTNYKEFILFKYSLGRCKRYTFDFSSIIDDNDKLKEFVYLFSKKYLLEKMTPENAIEKSYHAERELEKEFYILFHNTRMLLINEFCGRNVEKSTAVYAAQLFLNRLTFIFFAEDHLFVKKDLLLNEIEKTLSKMNNDVSSTNVFDKIQNMFRWFANGDKDHDVFGFNGEMFEIGYWPDTTKFLDLNISTPLKEIKGNKKYYDVKRLDFLKKYSNINPIIMNILIMDSYDFNSDLTVNILGHIFEQSISDLEDIQKNDVSERKNLEDIQKNDVSERKNFGIYYTPPYITDYICRNSIIPYLSKSGKATDANQLVLEYAKSNEINILEKKFKMIKILDPACGSGAFLVKAVDILLEIHSLIQKFKEWKKISTSDNKKKPVKKLESFFAQTEENIIIREIIENNIYGVDINHVSVKIAKLSMFFKLASNERKLPNLSKNIIEGNTLLTLKTDDDQEPLDWAKQFPDICNTTDIVGVTPGFDVIIGNPPYVRQERIQNKDKMQLPVTHNLKLKDKFIIPRRADLSNYFFYHCLNWLKRGGMMGFIISDSWMHFNYGEPTQKMLLDNSKLRIMIMPTYKVFSDADMRTVVVMLQKTNNDNNIINIANLNLGGLLANVIFKKIPQNKLKPGNWKLYFIDDNFLPTITMTELDKTGFMKRGITTGNNRFFVLSPDIIKNYDIIDQYKKPMISRSIAGHVLENDMAKSYLLDVQQTKRDLIKTEHGEKILKYIEYGEKNKIHNISTISAREPWYSLNLGKSPSIFLSQIINKHVKIYENINNFFALDTYAYFTPHNKDHVHAFLAFFSSSWFSLYMEINGHPMGGGALKFQIQDYKKSQVPDFNNWSNEDLRKITKAWLTYREGFDQKKLDDVVLTVLGFSLSEQNELKKILDDMINTRIKTKNSTSD